MWFLKILLIIVLVLVLLWLFVRFATKNIIEYHSNGRLKLEGESFFNRRNGVFKLFDEDGNLVGRWHYEKGQIIKQECINPTNGKVWRTTRNSEPKVVIDLSNAEQKVLNDKELVLQAVKSKPSNLQHVKSSLADDLDVLLEVVKHDGMMLRFVSQEMKKNKILVLTSVRQNGFSIQYADSSIKIDKEVVTEAVNQDGRLLRFADDEMKKNKQVVLSAVRQNGYALAYADESMRIDREVVLEAVKTGNRSHVNRVVNKDGTDTIRFNQSSKTKSQLAREAVSKNTALAYADKCLQKDKEIVLEAVRQNGIAIRDADQSLKKDREIVESAILQNGYALEFADQSFLTDKSLLFTSIIHIPKPKREIFEILFDFSETTYSLFISLIFQKNQNLIRKMGISSFKFKIVELLDKLLKIELGGKGKASDILVIVFWFFFLALVACLNVLLNHPWDWGDFVRLIFLALILYGLFIFGLVKALKELTLLMKKRLILKYLKST